MADSAINEGLGIAVHQVIAALTRHGIASATQGDLGAAIDTLVEHTRSEAVGRVLVEPIRRGIRLGLGAAELIAEKLGPEQVECQEFISRAMAEAETGNGPYDFPANTKLYALHKAPTQLSVREGVPPRWYTQEEIAQVLRSMNYGEPIIAELAPWFYRHLQSAFDKGFQKAQDKAEASRLSQGAQGEVEQAPCDGRGWGWVCTQDKGHEGPCTTIPVTYPAERAAVPDERLNCRVAGPGRGLCDRCAAGYYDECRYTLTAAPQPPEGARVVDGFSRAGDGQ